MCDGEGQIYRLICESPGGITTLGIAYVLRRGRGRDATLAALEVVRPVLDRLHRDGRIRLCDTPSTQRYGHGRWRLPLGPRTRASILDVLARGPASRRDLVRLTRASQSSVDDWTARLYRDGIISFDDGMWRLGWGGGRGYGGGDSDGDGYGVGGPDRREVVDA